MGLLEVREIGKSYPGVRALDQVSLSFRPGEIHGIIGENGAGKSTLMKILSGVEQPSDGQILLDGKPIVFRDTQAAISAGITMIHQELNLVDDLSVAENIFLGREPRSIAGLDKAHMYSRSKELLAKVGCDVHPRTMVRDLSVARKQLVEIAKALSYNAQYVIMDEPTAVLSEKETTALFRLISELKAQGKAVILISHILSELLENCDQISVLRDGKHVATIAAAESNQQSLAHMMVGRELGELYPPARDSARAGETVLDVENVVVPGYVNGVSFTVKSAEIVGFAGLIGSGRTELCEAIAGFRSRSAGTVTINGRRLAPSNPAASQKAGIAYVSEDRKSLGLHLQLAIARNVTMAHLSKLGSLHVNRKLESETAEQWRERLGMKIASVSDPVSSLSGGNQQKVSLAKWLECEPSLILLDEPTRGVDIGSKAEIYRLIHRLAEDGKAIVMVSSEMPELIGVCDRILVMREGLIVGELEGKSINEENIMELAAGVHGVTV